MLNTLLVEDNASYRESLHQLLAGHFPLMQIAEAADEQEALSQALAQRFDLIFTDIRLPHGNGLDLTRSIKQFYIDTVICILTSYNLLEYREAAIENGADRFMVKGESTEAEIVSLVESFLRTRFISLLIMSDRHSCEQLNALLSIHWPLMVTQVAMDAATGLGQTRRLKPDLVLLEMGMPGVRTVDLVHDIRAVSPYTLLVGMTDDVVPVPHGMAMDWGLDHCVSSTPFGYTRLVTILNAIHPEQTHH
jgi:DNA-binding NarL/FixJ family response regulator